MYSLLILLSCLSPLLPLFSEEVCNEETQKMVSGDLKGIVLLGSYVDLNGVDLKKIKGVEQFGLCIPGEETELFQRLENYFIHKSLTEEEIRHVQDIIAFYYREQFRPVITILVPDQDIPSSGVLQLIVIESSVGDITAYGALYFSNSLLAGYVRLKKGGIIDEKVLLDDLYFMNRNIFRKTDVVYSSGENPETTNIELITKDSFPLKIYAGADNTGLGPIGRNRWFSGVNWGNAFGFDHTLTYQFTASFNINRFEAHTIQYTAPLPWRHILVGFGGYSLVEANHFGKSSQASGRYIIPFHSSQNLHHEITLGYDFKRTNNTYEFSEEPVFGKYTNISQFLTEYSLEYDNACYKTAFTTSLFFSPAEMVEDQTRSDFESLRTKAKPEYVYGKIYLKQWVSMPCDFSFIGYFRGQLASCNLLPSEQFGLGGYDTVRGYEERTINRDNALLINAEFHTPSYKIFSSKSCRDEGLQLLGFIDYGIGHNCKLVPGEPYSTTLAGFGPGLRYHVNSYLNARFDWGIKLHRIPQDHLWSRLHFSLTASY